MAALKSLMNLDEDTRRQVMSSIRILYQSLKRSLPESPLKALEERFSFLSGKDQREDAPGDGPAES